MKRYVLFALGTVLTVVLDQWTKVLSVQALVVPNGNLPTDAAHIRSRLHTVFESWFNFRVAGNKGAAWGLFRNLPDSYRVMFFVVISAVAIVVIVMLYIKAVGQPLLSTALTMILGGAIGNLIDRVRLGFVVDFIDWHYQSHHWPTFNIADVAISVWVGLLLLDTLLQGLRERKKSSDPV